MDLSKPQNPRYVTILGLASCLILIIGWLARPRESAPVPAPIPSETEVRQLARRAERRSLENIRGFFAALADDVEPSIVFLPENNVTGVEWEPGLIVTPPLGPRPSGGVTIEAVGAEVRARTGVGGAQLPLATVQVGGALPGLTPVRRTTMPARPGDWVMAVWRTESERPFATGSFLHTAAATCGLVEAREVISSLSPTRTMSGGGLFDIDGNLLAVILPCNDRFAAIATASVESILGEAATFEHRVLARYGVILGALTADEAAYFSPRKGVIVREVWTDHVGYAAGLQPGDIIVALNGSPVASPDELRDLVRSPEQETFELAVRRGSSKLAIALPPSKAAPEPGSGVGLVWEAPERSYRIDSVVPGSPAAAAGIEPGDRLVRIDHVAPASLARVQRILAGGKALPVFVEVDRNGRRLGLLVQ